LTNGLFFGISFTIFFVLTFLALLGLAFLTVLSSGFDAVPFFGNSLWGAVVVAAIVALIGAGLLTGIHDHVQRR